MSLPRHRIFLSFHHANDEKYKQQFEELFGRAEKVIHSRSVMDGDINPRLKAEEIRTIIRDNYLGSSTVTVVLVGTETWRRKHVDWEIASSLRNVPFNRRSGLVGIVLPSRWDYIFPYQWHTIPQRLVENVRCGYAALYPWTDNPVKLAGIIHAAFERRDGPHKPAAARRMMRQNVPVTLKKWS